MMGHSPSYSPPPGPPPGYPGSTSTAATVDRRPEGTVVQQGVHVLAGTGSSSHQPFTQALPSQYAFQGLTPPGPIQDALQPHWGSNDPASGSMPAGQIFLPQTSAMNAPYNAPMSASSALAFDGQSSWVNQNQFPPNTQTPPIHNFSPTSPGNFSMYTPTTPQYPQWSPTGQSSSLANAIVPRPSSTHSSHSSSHSQSPYAGILPVAPGSEPVIPTATRGDMNIATSRYAEPGSALGVAHGPARIHRTSRRPRSEASPTSPNAGSSASTQETTPFDGDEDADADADGETDHDVMSEAESEPVRGTRKRRHNSVKGAQRGKGKRQSKMHACLQCNKQFPRPSGLEIHVTSVHSGKKPYGCPVPSCHKFFAVRSNMTRHLKTHGAEGTAARNRLSSQVATTVSSGDRQTELQLEYTEPQTIPSPTTWSQPTNYKWVQVPGSLETRTNIGALRQRAASSSSLSGSSSGASMTQARLSISPSSSTDRRGSRRTRSPLDEALLSMPTLTSPLPPVTPSPPNAVALLASPLGLVTEIVSNGGIEERDSYAHWPVFPYHPEQFRGLPGPAPAVRPLGGTGW